MKKISLIFAGLFVILLLVSCKHTHDFGEWSYATLPTCTSEGVGTRMCECGETEEKTIPVADHVAGEASCTRELLCTECGEVIGPKLDHVVEEETSCTKWRACKLCGKTVQTAPGHDWIEASCTEPKTCARCNETEGMPLGHQWVWEPTASCKICGTERAALYISGSAEEAQSAELHYMYDRSSIVGGNVKYETADRAMHTIWTLNDGVDANIKDFPVVLILTANLCTCDYDGICCGEENCSLSLTVGDEKPDPINLQTYFFDRPYGWFNYFYYDYSSEIAEGLEGGICDIEFTVNGITADGTERSEIYFIGFFKTLEEAEQCAGRYLATMWATEE